MNRIAKNCYRAAWLILHFRKDLSNTETHTHTMIRKGDFNRIGSTKPLIHRVISSFPKTAQDISQIRQDIIQKNPANRDHMTWTTKRPSWRCAAEWTRLRWKRWWWPRRKRDENAHDLGLKIVCDIPWKGGLGYLFAGSTFKPYII